MKKEKDFIFIVGAIIIIFLLVVVFFNKLQYQNIKTKYIPINNQNIPIQNQIIKPEDLNMNIKNGTSPEKSNSLDSFTKCLTEKGVELYVMAWCPHCKHQKEMFGNSLKYLKLIECTQQQELCIQKGIEAVPTWILPNGERLLGVQDFDTLSQKTGCKLNQ